MIHRTGTKPKGFRLYYFTQRAINTHKTENRLVPPTLPSSGPPTRFSVLRGNSALASAGIQPILPRFWAGCMEGARR